MESWRTEMEIQHFEVFICNIKKQVNKLAIIKIKQINSGGLNKMAKESNKTIVSGVSFSGLLTIAFIVLKLLNIIDWSWFWVLSPVLIPTFIVIIVTVFIYFILKKISR